MVAIDPNTLDFDLPAGLIAQFALPDRTKARLLVLNRETGALSHDRFENFHSYFKKDDVLVLNKTKVMKARVMGRKKTGGAVDMLLLGPTQTPSVWRALIQPSLKDNQSFFLPDGFEIKVIERLKTGECAVNLGEASALDLMSKWGQTPLPPYIKRTAERPLTPEDELLYQTVYAETEGSVAAPTAGLHFTDAILGALQKRGVHICSILLHVGWGTFRPIRGALESHTMLPERYEIDASTFNFLRTAKKNGQRIVAVGTTVARTLETLARLKNSAKAPLFSGETSLFIKPPFHFKWVDALLTNFHVPRSTPMALVGAFAGMGKIEKAYQAAIDEKYRFFSFGDTMFVHGKPS